MKNSHDPLSKDFESHLTFLFNNIHATTKISFSLFDKEFHLLSSLSGWENHISNFFFLNCPFASEDLAGSKTHAPFYFSDILHLNWFIFPLTVSESFLVFGPVFETEITPVFFQKKLDFQNMSVSSQIRFLKMLKDIPVIPYMQFQQYAAIVYYGLYNQNLDSATIISTHQASKESLAENITLSELMNTSKNQKHHIPQSHGSRLAEKTMLENVRCGNITAPPYSDMSDGTVVGTLSNHDPLRQAKNLIITQTTLITRAAVDGGMHSEAAYSLSDFYIQQVELCNTENEVYALSGKIYHTFVKQVHEIRTQNYSPIVRFMCTYIEKHIFEVISLNTIASELGYDTYYLTTLFKKDTGKNIKNYILEQKMAQAKILLDATSMEVREISERLAFRSVSYFCTQFKKYTGETPLSYRKTVHSLSKTL